MDSFLKWKYQGNPFQFVKLHLAGLFFSLSTWNPQVFIKAVVHISNSKKSSGLSPFSPFKINLQSTWA